MGTLNCCDSLCWQQEEKAMLNLYLRSCQPSKGCKEPSEKRDHNPLLGCKIRSGSQIAFFPGFWGTGSTAEGSSASPYPLEDWHNPMLCHNKPLSSPCLRYPRNHVAGIHLPPQALTVVCTRVWKTLAFNHWYVCFDFCTNLQNVTATYVGGLVYSDVCSTTTVICTVLVLLL